MVDLNELQKQVYQNKLDKKFNVTDVSMQFALTYGELSEAYESWWKKKGLVFLRKGDIIMSVKLLKGEIKHGSKNSRRHVTSSYM